MSESKDKDLPATMRSAMLAMTKPGSKPFASKKPVSHSIEAKDAKSEATTSEPEVKKEKTHSRVGSDKSKLQFIDPDKIEAWELADRGQRSLEQNVESLLQSIHNTKGNEQAIVVRPKKGKKGFYEAISGRTRLECCKQLNLKVKCEVRELDDTEAYAVQFRENDKRAGISAFDRAISLNRAMDKKVFKSLSHAAIELEVKKRYAERLNALMKNWGEVEESLVSYYAMFQEMGINAIELLKQKCKASPEFLAFFFEEQLVEQPTEKLIHTSYNRFIKGSEKDNNVSKSNFVKRAGQLGDFFSMDVNTGKINVLKHGQSLLTPEQIISILEREFEKAEKKLKN